MRRAIGSDARTSCAALLLGLSLLGWAPSIEAAVQVAIVTDTPFRHNKHRDVECRVCHEMQSRHGAFLVQDVSDCRSCHHTKERADYDCSECHSAGGMKDVAYTLQRSFTLTVRDGPADRELAFRHANHSERECAECHAEGPSLAVPDLECQSCHDEHHEATNSGCMSCHQKPPDDAHTSAVHESCSGSGCHKDSPIRSTPRTRVGCLWCHEEQAEHEPQAECITCHFPSAPGNPAESPPAPYALVPNIVGHERG